MSRKTTTPTTAPKTRYTCFTTDSSRAAQRQYCKSLSVGRVAVSVGPPGPAPLLGVRERVRALRRAGWAVTRYRSPIAGESADASAHSQRSVRAAQLHPL
jgi:hypothetical protein